MGDPRTGEIYVILNGQEPKEGDIKLNEGEAGYLRMLSDSQDRIAVLQSISRKAKEASETLTRQAIDMSKQLERKPNAVIDPEAWRSLLKHAPKDLLNEILGNK